MNDIDHFQLLDSKIARFHRLAGKPGLLGLLGQEALRFRSIAGTLKVSTMLTNSSVDERFITHILARSVIEGFFWLIYIFDDVAKRQERYEELISLFKRQYLKLHNEQLPINSQLPKPDERWKQLKGGLDVRSMLKHVQNNHGDELIYLYSIYRITSFDTHGRSLNNVLTTALGGTAPNFPVLDLVYGFDLIANHYLCILQELDNAGEA